MDPIVKLTELFDAIEKKWNLKFNKQAAPKATKTKDGKTFEFEGEDITGKPVFEIVDGEKVVAADGTHTMEDGATCTITGGVVTEYKPFVAVDPPADPPAQVDPPADPPAQETDKQIADLNTKVDGLVSENTQLKETVAEFSKTFESLLAFNKQTLEVFTEFANQEPDTATGKNGLPNNIGKTPAQRMSQIDKIIAELKTNQA